MKSFPEEYELIDIFECEPQIMDKKLPWFYNSLKFILNRNKDLIELELEPSIGLVKIVWSQSERQLMSLHLENVMGLEIEKNKGIENLHIIFRGENFVNPLILQLKPEIHIKWGTVLYH